MALGHEGDHVNNMVSLLWAYGGRIANEQGVPDMINPANKAGIDMAVQLWKAKLIPPDTFAQTVTSWNNETYQKSRGLIAVNPAPSWAGCWSTTPSSATRPACRCCRRARLAPSPKAAPSRFNYYKKAPLAAEAPSALEFFMQPDNLERISKSVEGRFVPVYRDHAKTEFWDHQQVCRAQEDRRVRAHSRIPGRTVAWLPDVTDSTFTSCRT